MSDMLPLKRLHRALERYEEDIDAPGGQYNVPTEFLFRVREELNEQATLVAHWHNEALKMRAERDEARARAADLATLADVRWGEVERLKAENVRLRADLEEIQQRGGPV